MPYLKELIKLQNNINQPISHKKISIPTLNAYIDNIKRKEVIKENKKDTSDF
jgi:hypothetical protein